MTCVSDPLERACLRVLEYNLGLRPGERALLLSDMTTRRIGDAFEAAARFVTREVQRYEIQVPRYNGEEPPEYVARAMAGADVVVMPLARSLSWTRARAGATASGARVASLPGITEEIALAAFDIEYEPVRERANRLCDLLDSAADVRVRTHAGTDLVLSVDGRIAHGRKGGIYRRPGEWGNLPCGEAFIAPVEGTAEGAYVVDASHGGVGGVAEPIHFTVRAGRVVDLRGGSEAAVLCSLLADAGDPLAYSVAELGIGCNHGVTVCGVPLVDEKVLGTCHIAVGGNSFFGGVVRVALHLDGILRAPSIWIDGRPIMEGGRLRLP